MQFLQCSICHTVVTHFIISTLPPRLTEGYTCHLVALISHDQGCRASCLAPTVSSQTRRLTHSRSLTGLLLHTAEAPSVIMPHMHCTADGGCPLLTIPKHFHALTNLLLANVPLPQ